MTDAPTNSPSSAPSSSRSPAGHRSPPNYAARRMLVSTIVITSLVALAVLGWGLLRDDDGSSVGGGGTWNEIALIDMTTGQITSVDGDGSVLATMPALGRIVSVESIDEHLALIGSDQIVLTDLDDADPLIIATERRATVVRLPIADALTLAIGDPLGGNVTVVDGLTRDVLDIGELAGQTDPLYFVETVRHDDVGAAFAVADAARFQTIVARPATTVPTFYPDVPLALGGEVVATSQVVGQRADIGLYDAEGKNLTVVPTEIPAGGVMVDDGDRLLVVSVGGGIFGIKTDDREPIRLGELAVPVGGSVRGVEPTTDGERLVVHGDVFQAVVAIDGTTVFTTTFTAPVSAPQVQPGWSCLPVGGDDIYHSLISLDTGEQLADLSGLIVTGTSNDGCTVIGERAGVTELVTAEGTVTLGRLRMAELGPDGRSIVWQTTDGRTELVEVDDDLELGDPIDLSDIAPTTLAVAFLDR